MSSLSPTTHPISQDATSTPPPPADPPSLLESIDHPATEHTDDALSPESRDSDQAQVARNLEKRRLQALANKKDGDIVNSDGGVTSAPISERQVSGMTATVASESGLDPASPGRSASPYSDAASPHRYLRSTSPRHLSPATSMIFERDVQENVVAPELAPAVPNHIQTEDHIPAVLEASSLAITDDRLGPDDVEIVMHNAHQPATIPTSVLSNISETHSWVPNSDFGLGLPRDTDELGSTYGALDTNDPRRLSFISFADVVHAEHAEKEDPLNMLGLSSASGSITANRSPSPHRSPVLNQGRRMSPGMLGESLSESSPIRGLAPVSSPLSMQSNVHGELTIETMRQALEKTGSNDQPLSAGGVDIGHRSARASSAGL